MIFNMESYKEPVIEQLTVTIANSGKAVYVKFENLTTGYTDGPGIFDGTVPLEYTVSYGDSIKIWKGTTSSAMTVYASTTVTNNLSYNIAAMGEPE